MAFNSVFNIIRTYLQKIGESLNINIPEFSPEFGREVKGFKKSPACRGALAWIIQSNGSGVREGFKPLMKLG